MFNKVNFFVCFLVFICLHIAWCDEKDEVRVNENELILDTEDYFESPQWFSLLVRGGSYVPNNATGPNNDFQTQYGSQNGAWVEVSAEVQPFTSMGVLGVRATSGVHYISGTGTSSSNFMNVPIHVGLAYHFKYFRHQLFVPFVEGGGSYYFLRQSKNNSYSRTREGYYGSGGLQLNLNYIEKRVAERFDLNYGVNNTYFTAEYRYISTPNAGVLDLTGGFLMGGFMMEF